MGMKRRFKVMIGAAALLVAGFAMPYSFRNPVEGATVNDYNQKSFWYYPWGTSVTHKGVDIFKKKGTPIHAASGVEWVLYAGEMPGKGGNVVITLAPKWRLHYYAHMDEVTATPLSVVTHNSTLGTVGNTGNAATTPSHLHFGIGTIYPRIWDMDYDHHGERKAFYLNPIPYLNEHSDK